MTALSHPRIRSLPPTGRPVLPVLLLISGFVAVVYEIVWQRQFALLFGSAAPATAAVLAAYFAGLGTGAWLVGRLASRWRRPLIAYAVLELLIGVGALMVAPLIGSFETIYPGLYAAFAGYPAGFTATRVVVAFLTLLLPTFCMGGTIPVVGALVDGGQRKLGLTAGWLYLVNTLGAGLGALAVPFLFLPQLGMRGSTWLCAAVNGVIALVAWRLDRSESRGVVVNPIPVWERTSRDRPLTTTSSAGLLPLALISGVVTFALQVLWNRAFAQIHENSMYSFAVIVGIVIFALALGAQGARVGLRRGFDPFRLVGGAWIAAGLLILAGPWLFLKLSGGLGYLPTAGGWGVHAARLAGLAGLVVLPPMALLGVGLPALMQDAGKAEGATSRALGRLLAVNIAGSVVGALAAGFLLPAWLGLWNGMLALGTLVLAAGAWARWRRSGVALGVAWCASVIAVAQFDIPRVRVLEARHEQLLSIAEGTHGITAVVARGDDRRLKLNNHYRLGGSTAVGDERMQAHIPLLLHPAPHRVGFLGLGTGITAGGALFHPVDQLTVMELVPEVVIAARNFFHESNHTVLDDPRTRIVADDARNYLRGSRAQFDVIIGDLVVPWRQGEGALFTLEQFTAARAALTPGGLFCQWLPLFQLSEVEVNILTRTFLTVFPHAQVWRGDFSPTEPAIALIGYAGEPKLDVAMVRRRLAEMQPDVTNPQLGSAAAFWMNWVGDLEMADLPASEVRLNREDRPWIELLGPMLHTGGDESTLFTGRRLQAWLEHVAERSRLRRTALPEPENSAVAAGRTLSEMTQCFAENDRAGALAAQEKLKQLLPAETFRLLMQ